MTLFLIGSPLDNEYNCSCTNVLKNVLALASFILLVNGGRDFGAQKSAFINHKILHMANAEVQRRKQNKTAVTN